MRQVLPGRGVARRTKSIWTDQIPAVHTPHPAATHRRIGLPAMRSFKDYCKGGNFYEENQDTIYRLLS